MARTDTNTLDQSEPGSNGNEGFHHMPQNSITGPSPSNDVECHISGHSFLRMMTYPFAEIQSAYFTALADWAAANSF